MTEQSTNKAKSIQITTPEFFILFKTIEIETSVLGYIKKTMKGLAENSHGDIVWISRKGKEIHREKANYKQPKMFRNFYNEITK